MARGRSDGSGPGSTPTRDSVANERGLRALGDRVDRGHRGTRRRSGKPKWSLRRKVFVGVTGVIILALAAAGGVWGYATYRFDQISKVHVAADRRAVPGQPFNMLVIGSDSRVGEGSAFGSTAEVSGQRSDVMMIWHVVPATRQITIMSIPRDTLVQMVGADVQQFGQFNRLNAAYNSGADALVATIEANFGIPINHVVQIDFGGFQGAVDALGGVWMDFTYPAKDAYSDLGVLPGCQLLNGTEALAVARSRHYEYYADGYWQYDPTGDFGRIKRQDAFLKALIDAAESKVNPLTINAFIGSLHNGIVIDDGFSLGGVAGLATEFHSFNPSNLDTQTMPTMSTGYVDPWGDVLFVDQPAAQQMFVSIFGDELTTPTDPPPDENLNPQPPPVVTPTTSPPAAPATAPSTTPTTAPPPDYDPVPCSPK
jgi:LCP family protein required for cell wall assembly